jgi:hypothetical protein
MTFYRTIAPTFSERVLHRGQIVIQLPHETLHSLNPGTVCFFHPARLRGNLPGLLDAAKAHHHAAHSREIRAGVFESVHLSRLPSREQRPGLAQQRAATIGEICPETVG